MEWTVWNGVAAIVVHREKLLMIRTKNSIGWRVPSTQIYSGESAFQACKRKVWEDTGYKSIASHIVFTKRNMIKRYKVMTQYCLCQLVSEKLPLYALNDLVIEYAWVNYDQFFSLHHTYKEDQLRILQYISTK